MNELKKCQKPESIKKLEIDLNVKTKKKEIEVIFKTLCWEMTSSVASDGIRKIVLLCTCTKVVQSTSANSFFYCHLHFPINCVDN